MQVGFLRAGHQAPEFIAGTNGNGLKSLMILHASPGKRNGQADLSKVLQTRSVVTLKMKVLMIVNSRTEEE